MQIQLTDAEEAHIRETTRINEEARVRYVNSPEARNTYVDGLEKKVIKLSYLLAWAKRLEINPEELNIEELKGLLLNIHKTTGM